MQARKQMRERASGIGRPARREQMAFEKISGQGEAVAHLGPVRRARRAQRNPGSRKSLSR